jgi:hypothetical protein
VIVQSTIHDFSAGVQSNRALCSGTAHVDIEMDFKAPQALGHGGEVPQHLPRPKHSLFTTEPTLMCQEPCKVEANLQETLNRTDLLKASGEPRYPRPFSEFECNEFQPHGSLFISTPYLKALEQPRTLRRCSTVPVLKSLIRSPFKLRLNAQKSIIAALTPSLLTQGSHSTCLNKEMTSGREGVNNEIAQTSSCGQLGLKRRNEMLLL